MAMLSAKQEKWLVMAGMGLTGYTLIAQAFPQLPQLPAFVNNTIFGQVTLITIAAALTLYGIFVLSKY